MSEKTILISLLVIKCLLAILVGILEGNGAVYFFNKMPAEWFCDYGEEPTAEMRDPYTQRVKSHPWKYIFTMAFIILNIKMVSDDWQFAIAGTAALWLLLELSISDLKYRIVPDQLLVLLTITGFGFMPYHGSWEESVFGAVLGFALMGLIAGVGKLLYHKLALGGGDIKLYTILGFLTGVKGIVFIFVLSTLVSAAWFVIQLARRKIKKTDTQPMVPYIAAAAALYIVFFWDMAITI